jgi:hypothetical protein
MPSIRMRGEIFLSALTEWDEINANYHLLFHTYLFILRTHFINYLIY